MHRKFIVMLAMITFVGGCTAVGGPGGTSQKSNGIPENVIAMAAPYQDVATARILPADGCYWYRHVGPVETTLLPLRTIGGRPICTAQE